MLRAFLAASQKQHRRSALLWLIGHDDTEHEDAEATLLSELALASATATRTMARTRIPTLHQSVRKQATERWERSAAPSRCAHIAVLIPAFLLSSAFESEFFLLTPARTQV